LSAAKEKEGVLNKYEYKVENFKKLKNWPIGFKLDLGRKSSGGQTW